MKPNKPPSHGFVLPVLQETVPENVEFTRLDWAKVGTKYGVANCLMASYYRQVLAMKRGPESGCGQKPSFLRRFTRASAAILAFCRCGGHQGERARN